MSGIEVAGLVLGGFPILLSGLGGMRNSCQGVKKWWKIRETYGHCLYKVTAEYTEFRVNLKNLLETVAYDDDELNDLLNDPNGAQWASKDLEKRLRDRLPMSHRVYLDTMDAMNDALIALGKEMKIANAGFQQRVAASSHVQSPQGHTAKATASNLKGMMLFGMHRTKYTIDANVRDALLEELRQGNQKLKRFSEESPAEVKGHRRSQGRKKAISPSLYGYWQHARDVYRLLQRASLCSCRNMHRAHITLQDHQKGQGVEFRVLFTYADSITCKTPNGWNWQETRIALEPPVTQQKTSAPPTPSAPSTVSTPTATATANAFLTPSDPTRQHQRRVSWADLAVQAAMLPLRPLSTATLPTITDLCATVSSSVPANDCLGVLRDNQKGYTIHLSESGSLPKTMLEQVSLRDLLAGDYRISLTRRQRFRIARAVGSAYLQLHASPWLGINWISRCIYLLYDPIQCSLVGEPRIARDFVTANPTSSADNTIGALGIVLLELCLNKVLEQYPLYSSNLPPGGPDEWYDIDTARRWCVNHAFDEDEDYAGVAHWCFQQSPRIEDNQDRKWRQDLFDYVVQPLEECCRKNFG